MIPWYEITRVVGFLGLGGSLGAFFMGFAERPAPVGIEWMIFGFLLGFHAIYMFDAAEDVTKKGRGKKWNQRIA